MKLAEHIKAVRSVQALLVTVPILAKFFDHKSGLPFPPLGDDVTIWRAIAFIVVIASMVVTFGIPAKTQRRVTILALFTLTVAFAGTFLVLEQLYVVPIGVSASEGNPEGATAFVCRGDRRSDLKPDLAALDEDDLIESTGLRDARLLHIYTSNSLRSRRQQLFWTYTLALASLELLIGVAARTNTSVLT